MTDLDKAGCMMLEVPQRIVIGSRRQVVSSGLLTLYHQGDGYWRNDIRELRLRPKDIEPLLKRRQLIEKPMPQIERLVLPARFFFRVRYTRYVHVKTGIRIAGEPADMRDCRKEAFTHSSAIDIVERITCLAGVRWKMSDGTPFETDELNGLIRRGVIEHIE